MSPFGIKDGDCGVPDHVMQLIQERPHGGKVRPKYVAPEPSGWSVVDQSKLAFLMTPAAPIEEATAGPLDDTSTSKPEGSDERSEWARFPARRKVTSGGLGNGAVSGFQVKQHRQDTLARQKLKLAILEARLGKDGVVKPSVSSPTRLLRPRQTLGNLEASSRSKSSKIQSGVQQSAGPWDPASVLNPGSGGTGVKGLSSASNPLNIEGVELSSNPDFSGPIEMIEAQERIAADSRKRSTSPNRNRNGTHRQSTEAQVVLVPWSISTNQNRRVEVVPCRPHQKDWL